MLISLTIFHHGLLFATPPPPPPSVLVLLHRPTRERNNQLICLRYVEIHDFYYFSLQQSQPLASISPVRTFCPPATSTPKSDRSSPPQEDRHVVAEGERRTFIREKDERVDKAMSIYENVNPGESKANESTVWYEYGCV